MLIRYPNKYTQEINKYSEEFNVDSTLVRAVIWTESKFKKDAVSSLGASGLMQLMPNTASWCAKVLGVEYSRDMIFDVDINIRLGTFYLSYLLAKFDEPDAISAYNAGENNVALWKQNGLTEPLFEETKTYVKRVLHAKKIYSWR